MKNIDQTCLKSGEAPYNFYASFSLDETILMMSLNFHILILIADLHYDYPVLCGV